MLVPRPCFFLGALLRSPAIHAVLTGVLLVAASPPAAQAGDAPCGGNDCLLENIENENECVEYRCVADECVAEPISEGLACDDDDLCTFATRCRSGECRGTEIVCSDLAPCLHEYCLDGDCLADPVPDGTACDDGDACTQNQCSEGACVSTTPTDCNDDDACTVDRCDSESGCVHAPLDQLGPPTAAFAKTVQVAVDARPGKPDLLKIKALKGAEPLTATDFGDFSHPGADAALNVCALDGRGEVLAQATVTALHTKPNGKPAWKTLGKGTETRGYRFKDKSGALRTAVLRAGEAGKPALLASIQAVDLFGPAFPCSSEQELCTSPDGVCTHVYTSGADAGDFHAALCFDSDDIKRNRALAGRKAGKFVATRK